MPRSTVAIIALVLGSLATPLTQGAPMSHEVLALHRAAFEWTSELRVPPMAPSRELGLRYIDGRGVDRDVIQGCALLSRADIAAQSSIPYDQTVEALLKQHCERLSDDEIDEVGYVSGCGFIGLKAQTFHLEAGSWVEFSRLGIAVDRPSGRTEERRAWDPACGGHVMLLRRVPLSSDTSADTSGRHLFEMITWKSGMGRNGLERTLHWNVLEVVDSRVEGRANGILVTESGSAWPTPSVPAIYRDGASFDIASTGVIRWKFSEDPTRQGTIEVDRKRKGQPQS